MITIEPIRHGEVDSAVLTEDGARDWANGTADGHRSIGFWSLSDEAGPILYMGVIRRSLLAPKEAWILPGRRLRERPMAAVRALRTVMTWDRWNALVLNDRNCKFARLLGFRPREQADGWVWMVT